jgi:hypothetical protein
MDKRVLSERDICTKFIAPALRNAGWDEMLQIREEVSFTKGRIIVRGKLVSRGRPKRADYVLYFKPNIPLALIVTISRYQPFFPIKIPVDTADVTQIKCNEIFALIYALGILETSFKPDRPEKIDLWLRILDVISAASAQTLEPYSTDQNLRINKKLSEYDKSIREIHLDDKPIISSLISIFELLSKKGEMLRS